MKTEIRPGAVIETATPAEMGEHLSRLVQQHFAEQARGLTTFRFDATDTPAAGAVQLPAIGEQEQGPRNGFVWQLGSVRCQGLSAGDSLSIWRNSTDPRNYIGGLSASVPYLFFHKLTFLKGGEKLIVTGKNLTATADITVNGEGVEAGELDLYKLL